MDTVTRGQLGVCYFPEHWDAADWPTDAEEMRALGIDFVRIGEFSWGVTEPDPGSINLNWLQDILDLLHSHEIKVVLCTPTATPPKWLVDTMPDMLATGRDGRQRGFGSRRHYSFAHMGYRRECARITRIIAAQFGQHPAVIGWQTDNEYGCHDTTLSYSPVDLAGFRDWLAQRYQSVERLNRAWGNVFWSMQYRHFDEVELPNQTVTEANPAHWLDFYRFTSQMVAEFNKLQVDILRELSPGRDIIHNFMGRILDFDHFTLGAQLDISSWDSYPLGFLDQQRDLFDTPHRLHFARSGDPDFQAFHHDLYRATSGGRWWIMEQQPGPVNWAPNNIAPRDGMISLWALEAFAHGAEAVSYFRWRQLPFAQEQMHAGLLRPDRSHAEGFAEARAVAALIRDVEWPATTKGDVAIVFDYESAWAWNIQPQGETFDYFSLVFDIYRGLRQLGLSVDFLSPSMAVSRMDDYAMCLVPGTFTCDEAMANALATTSSRVILGPRTASKTGDFAIPDTLAPLLPDAITPARISHVESLAAGLRVEMRDRQGYLHRWREFATPVGDAAVLASTMDGRPALLRRGQLDYLCGWPDPQYLDQMLRDACHGAGIATINMPDGVRLRRAGNKGFVVNYSDKIVDLMALAGNISVCHGSEKLAPSGFAIIAFDAPD